MFSTISSDWGTHFAGQVVQTLTKNIMSFLETITFVDVLCHQARTSWLYEIEQTAKYDYNFHDFLSDMLLASNLCFQILKNSSPQVTDGLKQFCDLYLWVKLKHFFFPVSSLQELETFGF